MKKSKLWRVTLTIRWDEPTRAKPFTSVPTPIVTVTVPDDTCPSNSLLIRTIKPRAAARKFIRGNLVTMLHVMDDGSHSPADLHDQTHVNHGKPHEELKHAKRRAKRFFNAPEIVINI